MIRTAILAAAALAMPALAAETADVDQAAIPYVSRDGILEWQADGTSGLYIRAANGRWYYARTLGKCQLHTTSLALGFETSALDQLDRHGAILVEGRRCPIDSLVESEAPPEKPHR